MNAKEKLGFVELVAMGVGGMVGGGIFSVLGLSMELAGHAAALAFLFGGALAMLTGLSYARLGLAFCDEGGSFTYLERAFRSPALALFGGWLLVVGYVGTMALYAYTFAAYGAALLGGSAPWLHHALETLVLLVFLAINLAGVRASGLTEDLIVLVKVLILAGFAVVGVVAADAHALLPRMDHGLGGLVMGAALIFVAYEGFELIPNAVHDARDPARDLPRAIFAAVAITAAIYVLVALVASALLTPEEVRRYEEYALARAAEPILGKLGFVLIGLGALLSTASAINATLFGTARLAAFMARERALPKVFSYRARTSGVPAISLALLAILTLAFVNLADLRVISSFASATFLAVFAGVNLAALRLRARIKVAAYGPALALAGCLASLAMLFALLAERAPWKLVWIVVPWLVVGLAAVLFARRAQQS